MENTKIMIAKARAAMQNSYSPYSKFKVGACLRAEDDQLFTGCNVENASYSVSQCAEASAIGNLVTAGKKHIREVVVITSGNTLCPPCGSCRQRINEFAQPDTLIHICNLADEYKTMRLQELLPYAFGPHDLI